MKIYLLSLEEYYKKINKRIKLVSAYTDNPYMTSIIKSCRLKPILDTEDNSKLDKFWMDEFGNILEITKPPTIKIKENSKTYLSSDIKKYKKIEEIIQESKLVCLGLMPNTNEFIIALLGNDSFIRTYHYTGTLQIISPLLLGLDILKVMNNVKLKYFAEIKDYKSEFLEYNWWIVNLPVNSLFKANINNEYLERLLYV